jgi:plastocyanin
MRKRLTRDRRVLAALLIALLVVGFSSVSALASSPKPVKVADDYFGVKRLVIGRGTTVSWKWAGVLRHNVTVTSGPAKFHSKTQVLGGYSHLFTKRGTYRLYCTLHTDMRMTVVVK